MSNEKKKALSSSVQPILSKFITIKYLQNVGNIFDKSITPFVPVEQDVEFF
jgi:hypothetical protein